MFKKIHIIMNIIIIITELNKLILIILLLNFVINQMNFHYITTITILINKNYIITCITK